MANERKDIQLYKSNGENMLAGVRWNIGYHGHLNSDDLAIIKMVGKTSTLPVYVFDGTTITGPVN